MSTHFMSTSKNFLLYSATVNSLSRFLSMSTNVLLMLVNSLFYRVHYKLHSIGFCQCTDFLLYREQPSKITIIHNNTWKACSTCRYSHLAPLVFFMPSLDPPLTYQCCTKSSLPIYLSQGRWLTSEENSIHRLPTSTLNINGKRALSIEKKFKKISLRHSNKHMEDNTLQF